MPILTSFKKMHVDFKYLIKTAVCIFVFLGLAMAFFGICGNLKENYLLIVNPPVLVRLVVFVVLFPVMIGVIAVLVRPFWVALLVFVSAAVLFLLMLGFSNATLITAGVMLLFLLFYFGVVNNWLKNQVNFSTHPLSEMKLLTASVLAVVVCVAFAVGYSADSVQKNYVITPEIKNAGVDFVMSQAKMLIDQQKGSAAQKASALKSITDKTKSTISDFEKKLEPLKTIVPVILGVVLFFILQIVFLALSFVSMFLTPLLFFILKLSRFVNVEVETREVKFLTLKSST